MTDPRKTETSEALTPRSRRGRPRIIKSVDKLTEDADAYFADCDERNKPFTMAGLAFWLGFTDRHGLNDYERQDEYSATIKRLRLRIEQQRNETLLCRTTFTPGIIFDLKNNHGWKDQQQLEHSGTVNVLFETVYEQRPVKG